MYWDWVGGRIGLLYYCFLSATSTFGHFADLYEEGGRLSGLELVVAWSAQSKHTSMGWEAAAKFSIPIPMDQEPNSALKVARLRPGDRGNLLILALALGGIRIDAETPSQFPSVFG
jgi:hypothetical protein